MLALEIRESERRMVCCMTYSLTSSCSIGWRLEEVELRPLLLPSPVLPLLWRGEAVRVEDGDRVPSLWEDGGDAVSRDGGGDMEEGKALLLPLRLQLADFTADGGGAGGTTTEARSGVWLQPLDSARVFLVGGSCSCSSSSSLVSSLASSLASSSSSSSSLDNATTFVGVTVSSLSGLAKRTDLRGLTRVMPTHSAPSGDDGVGDVAWASHARPDPRCQDCRRR